MLLTPLNVRAVAYLVTSCGEQDSDSFFLLRPG